LNNPDWLSILFVGFGCGFMLALTFGDFAVALQRLRRDEKRLDVDRAVEEELQRRTRDAQLAAYDAWCQQQERQ
jgi:hypothetical protein